MKKLFALICLFLGLCLFCGNAVTEVGNMGEITLAPGTYEVGIDIPEGYYDVRMKGLDDYCIIRYSNQTNLDDSLNMDSLNAFELKFQSNSNYWQGCHPNILLTKYSFLEIENSECTFYPIEAQRF